MDERGHVKTDITVCDLMPDKWWTRMRLGMNQEKAEGPRRQVLLPQNEI
jgi:hypothetical protein